MKDVGWFSVGKVIGNIKNVSVGRCLEIADGLEELGGLLVLRNGDDAVVPECAQAVCETSYVGKAVSRKVTVVCE